MDNIRVGKIVKPHGIDGELLIESYTEFTEKRFSEHQSFQLESNKLEYETLSIEHSKPHQQRLIVKFNEVDDRNQAENLRDSWLTIPRNEIEIIDENEYFGFQLEGLTVLNENSEEFGLIKKVNYPHENPVFEIDNEEIGILDFPVHRDFIQQIDREEETITLRFPSGWRKLIRNSKEGDAS